MPETRACFVPSGHGGCDEVGDLGRGSRLLGPLHGLALNLFSSHGRTLQPMAVAALGGMGVEVLVALFAMPCFCVMVATGRQSASARNT